MPKSKRVEFRYNDDKSLDEIVIAKPKFFHLEQMDTNCWWFALDIPGRERVSVFLRANGRIVAMVAEGEFDTEFAK